MNIAPLVVCLLLLVTYTSYSAAEECRGGNCAGCHTLTVKEAGVLLKDVGSVTEVVQAPVKGLWQVKLQREGRTAVAFMDYGKKYVLPGPLFPLTDTQNAQTPQTQSLNRIDVKSIPLTDSIVLGNPQGVKRLFVFTDPDCSYCRKLHGELKKLAVIAPDVTIYVKLFPLKMHPYAYDKARVILGRKSPDLLDAAFSGGTLPPPDDSCSPTPVDETITLGAKLGITGTPTLIFPDGSVAVGGRDVEALLKMLDGATGGI